MKHQGYSLLAVLIVCSHASAAEPLVCPMGGFSLRYGNGLCWGPRWGIGVLSPGRETANGRYIHEGTQAMVAIVFGIDHMKRKTGRSKVFFTELGVGVVNAESTPVFLLGGVGASFLRDRPRPEERKASPRLSVSGGTVLSGDFAVDWVNPEGPKRVRPSFGGTLGLAMPVNWFLRSSDWYLFGE